MKTLRLGFERPAGEYVILEYVFVCQNKQAKLENETMDSYRRRPIDNLESGLSLQLLKPSLTNVIAMFSPRTSLMVSVSTL